MIAYMNLSWYFMFFATLVLIFALYCAEPQLKIIDQLRENGKAVVLAVILVILGFIASPPDFRILADETNLLGVSQYMHETMRCVLPLEALYYYHGMKTILSEKIEMRPPAYPFVLSLVHNVIGYRPANAFILNGVLAWLILILLFLMIDSREKGLWGYIAMIALASFPVFVQYFTSAGFETFNLAMIMLTFFLLDRYLEHKSVWLSVAVIASLILVSHSRYESVLTLISVVPVLLYFLPDDATADWREKIVFAFPIFLLPALWLRTLTWEAARFQVDQIEKAFGLSNVWPNLKGFVLFFLSGKSQKFAGPVLTLLAMVGLILLIEKLWNMKLLREYRWMSISMISCAVFHALARLFYSSGNLMSPYTSRLAIVFLPGIVALAITGMRRIERNSKYANIAPAVLILACCLLITSWPVASANEGVRELIVFREFKWARSILEKHDVGEDSIIVSDRPNMYIPLNYSAITFDRAAMMAEQLEKMLKIKSYSRIIAVQHINYRKSEPEEALPQNLMQLKATVLFESQLTPAHFIRITEFQVP
ncbi:MAG: hypothetical protein Kow0029_13580 [Candidatus Rifleibacteriota bacterium]